MLNVSYEISFVLTNNSLQLWACQIDVNTSGKCLRRLFMALVKEIVLLCCTILSQRRRQLQTLCPKVLALPIRGRLHDDACRFHVHPTIWGMLLIMYQTVQTSQDSTRKNMSRAEQPMSDHLSTQGRPDSRGGLSCFWFPNKTWTPPVGASCTLRIGKNGLELKKFQPPKVEEGVKNSKKHKPLNTTKPVPDHPKNSMHVTLLLKSPKMICKTEGGAPITL